jgi:predicted RNA-binding Zn ribbon-like protein
MKPLLRADHGALEFLDTTMLQRGAPVELIGDGAAFMEWLVAAGLLDATLAAAMKRRFRVADLDAAAAEARKLRSWVRAWLTRWRAAPTASYEPELRRLNALLLRANDYRQMVGQQGRFELVERHRGDATGELLALLAAEIADLVVNHPPELVKECAGAECVLWFLDRTKAHRRRFCSVAACGNREKVAAFRERQCQRTEST